VGACTDAGSDAVGSTDSICTGGATMTRGSESTCDGGSGSGTDGTTMGGGPWPDTRPEVGCSSVDLRSVLRGNEPRGVGGGSSSRGEIVSGAWKS